MHLLRHFTIRRVVLWMMLISLGVVACAGAYSALTLRDIYRHADRADELTQQLTFLTRSVIVMQSGTAAEKIALISSIPEGTDWDDFRRARATTPADYAPAARARLDALTLYLAEDDAPVLADRQRLKAILIAALLAAITLLIFCDRYLVTHLVRPVAKIRAHRKIIASGDLTQESEDLGRATASDSWPRW